MQRKSFINSLAAVLVACAPIIPFNGCGLLVFGEPKLPKSMKKK